MLQTYASAENTSFSWYFKPSGNHEQPEVTPEAKSFIDKYDTIYLGDEKSNKIYLTFDAGYENGNVEKILDVLKEKNVQGAFFILPHLVECNTDLVIRMKNEGHLVCNHTLSHKNMSKVTDFENFSSELTDLEKFSTNIRDLKWINFIVLRKDAFPKQTSNLPTDLDIIQCFGALRTLTGIIILRWLRRKLLS